MSLYNSQVYIIIQVNQIKHFKSCKLKLLQTKAIRMSGISFKKIFFCQRVHSSLVLATCESYGVVKNIYDEIQKC